MTRTGQTHGGQRQWVRITGTAKSFQYLRENRDNPIKKTQGLLVSAGVSFAQSDKVQNGEGTSGRDLCLKYVMT